MKMARFPLNPLHPYPMNHGRCQTLLPANRAGVKGRQPPPRAIRFFAQPAHALSHVQRRARAA